MKLKGPSPTRLTSVERMVDPTLAVNVNAPISSTARRVRIAKTVAEDGEGYEDGDYPPEGSTAFPIVFVDASFTPVDETAEATYEERSNTHQAWVFSSSYLPEGAIVFVLRDNDLEVEDSGFWFTISGCYVDKCAIKDTETYPLGLYYHLACEDQETWHSFAEGEFGYCPYSSDSCDLSGYDPGEGWSETTVDGYDFAWENPDATEPPAPLDECEWEDASYDVLVGGDTLLTVFQWRAPCCNAIALGDNQEYADEPPA